MNLARGFAEGIHAKSTRISTITIFFFFALPPNKKSTQTNIAEMLEQSHTQRQTPLASAERLVPPAFGNGAAGGTLTAHPEVAWI